ncbi:MAG: hypothetical protein RMM06_11605 [Armatimonadota bacterium]|nr:hypothetical protein [Armatimonadota bacterium]
MMRGTVGAIRATLLLAATLFLAVPVRAIVIEDVVKHHPLVALVNSWSVSVPTPAPDAEATLNATDSSLPEGAAELPVPAGTNVSPDNFTVEVVPLRLPDLPTSVVFVFYLLGALVFYTLLVLVAQPGPAEYS